MDVEGGLMMAFSPGFVQELGAAVAHYHLPSLPEDSDFSGFVDDFVDSDTALIGNLLRASSISEYDLGGDLFKAAEPIIEETVPAVDPMTAAAISLISGADDVNAEKTIKDVEMESIQSENFLSEVFNDCKNELLAKCAIKETNAEFSEFKLQSVENDEKPAAKTVKLAAESSLQKSVSSGCLNSMDWINGCTMKPNFLDFQGVDFGTAFGLRRAYSEGDIKTLGSKLSSVTNTSTVQASIEQQLGFSDFKYEERQERLSRYRNKKNKRNFGRKIKYACRKALADSQPRIRGRFARTEECDIPKP